MDSIVLAFCQSGVRYPSLREVVGGISGRKKGEANESETNKRVGGPYGKRKQRKKRWGGFRVVRRTT